MKNLRNFRLSVYQELIKTTWANPILLTDKGEKVSVSEVSEGVLYQNYPVLLTNGERCSVNGKTPDKSTIQMEYDLKPPFVDGRIVDGITFAVRFKNFLDGVVVNDCCGEDELEYLKIVANDLLRWQISTVTDEHEKDYLRRVCNDKNIETL